jgi:hypothetical protein
MSKKLFFFGVAALLSVSLFMLGCPTGSVGRGGGGSSAAQLAMALAARLNKIDNGSAIADDATVTLQKPSVTLFADITVPAGVTLVVPASTTLTVADGVSIVLIGHANPAKLVLANKLGAPAGGGGGKLSLTGSAANGLGTGGVIRVSQAGPAAMLTATRSGVKAFSFTGDAAATGITNLDATAKGFKSIEAAMATNTIGQVTFVAGAANTTVIIDKETALRAR